MPTVPELVGAAINVAITDRLLDAQREASSRLVPFARRALQKAKDQFDAQMMLRDYDQEVYDYIGDLPEYEISTENINRASRSASFASVNQVKSTAFGISKYNCGDREEAINSALSAGIVISGQRSASAGNFEDALESAYLQLRWVSLANSSRLTSGGIGRSFGDISSSLVGQAESLGSQAEAGIASITNLATSSILKSRDASNPPSEIGNSTVDFRPSPSDSIA